MEISWNDVQKWWFLIVLLVLVAPKERARYTQWPGKKKKNRKTNKQKGSWKKENMNERNTRNKAKALCGHKQTDALHYFRKNINLS